MKIDFNIAVLLYLPQLGCFEVHLYVCGEGDG